MASNAYSFNDRLSLAWQMNSNASYNPKANAPQHHTNNKRLNSGNCASKWDASNRWCGRVGATLRAKATKCNDNAERSPTYRWGITWAIGGPETLLPIFGSPLPRVHMAHSAAAHSGGWALIALDLPTGTVQTTWRIVERAVHGENRRFCFTFRTVHRLDGCWSLLGFDTPLDYGIAWEKFNIFVNVLR